MNCYYCGKEPSQAIHSADKFTGSKPVLINGVDRVDNASGYISGNCVPCCWECNNLKRAVSLNIARKMIAFIDKDSK